MYDKPVFVVATGFQTGGTETLWMIVTSDQQRRIFARTVWVPPGATGVQASFREVFLIIATNVDQLSESWILK